VTEQYRLFVGIDWATESYEVCILDPARQVIGQMSVPHSGAGIAQFVDSLRKLAGENPACLAVGIEVPRGAMVETLVERCFPVWSLNPKQMDRFRDRHTVAGAKDDRRDAFVLADALRTDLALFRRVRLDEPLTIRLRELSRTEEDIQQAQVRTAHQCRDLRWRYYPQALPLCPGVDEPWFWDLIELAPLPVQARQLKPARLTRLLASHRIRRLDARQILTQLRLTPVRLAPGAAEAASQHALALLPLLRLLQAQRLQVARQIEAVLGQMSQQLRVGEHRDVTILLSLPGVGRIVCATMLAEASQALHDRDYHALRCYAGVAPITRRSGKRRLVLMRQSCNQRLRNITYHSHGRALRGVADRLLAVLMAMLQSGTLYNPHCRTGRAGSAGSPPA
jgi:hypothetical protein